MPQQSVSVCPVKWTRTSFHSVSIRGHLYRRVLTENDSFFEVSHIACKIDYLNEKKKHQISHPKLYIQMKSHGTRGLILNFKWELG